MDKKKKPTGKSFNFNETLGNREDFLDSMQTHIQTIEEVELVKIQEKQNVRKETQGIEELAASIQEKGQLSPIMIRSCGQGIYEIIYGHRRYKALCLLRDKEQKKGAKAYTTIKAIVKDKETFNDLEVKEIQIIENIQRENLNPYELKEAFEYLRAKGLKNKEIAKKLGKGEGFVKNTFSSIKTLNDNARLSALLKSNVNVTLTDIQEVKILPYKEQIQLIKEKTEGKIPNIKALRERVTELKDKLYRQNHITHTRRKDYELIIYKDNTVKMRAFKFDFEKNTKEDKSKLIETLKQLIDKLREEPL